MCSGCALRVCEKCDAVIGVDGEHMELQDGEVKCRKCYCVDCAYGVTTRPNKYGIKLGTTDPPEGCLPDLSEIAQM